MRNKTLKALPLLSTKEGPPRSVIAQALMWGSILASFAGVDLMGWFASHGFGADPAEIEMNLNALLAAGLGTWSWIERLAPWRRLTLFGEDP